MAQQDIAQYIEAALLRPDATEDQVRAFCNEARQRGWAAVCVNPTWVELGRNVLAGVGTRLVSVAGFPFGASVPSGKNTEARLSLESGASEINMVINIGALKGGEHAQVEREIAYVHKSVKNINPRALLKVIVECPLLSAEEKTAAARIAVAAKADFVMTGTGFAGPSTLDDVRILRAAAGNVPICAEGAGTAQELQAFVEAGAARVSSAAAAGLLTV